ncbi:MAG: peptidase M23 [Pseudooceanicola sp.]|nr:peptidase M23 [Pseudooceanicola sp.]
MRTRLAIKTHAIMERWFPERRVFLKSENDTRFIRLKSETQFLAFMGVSVVVAWGIVATAIVLMDSIGASNFRDQARRDQLMFQYRLNALSAERDERAVEAMVAQERFNTALAQISSMQSELLASETRRLELETGIDVIQTTLRSTMKARDTARRKVADLEAQTTETAQIAMAAAPAPLNLMSEALAETAQERDNMLADAENALQERDEIERELKLLRESNDDIFRQLEAAVAVSVEPLDAMFKSAGLSPDRLIAQVRRGYSGQGGPLTAISFSTRGEEPSPDQTRANRVLGRMDTLNMYRIAAEKVPFASPIRDAVRYTSGFGYRRDPKTGGRRMHNGSDFAGSMGTNIYATADGVVSHAGWLSGFGKLVKIKHDFGIETYYAHNSRILVKEGQRISRGDHIADMGNTGRVTGTHLHYEVRVDGTPVNPMTYIKAANNVFKKQDQRARK